jgi:hypothetical protein
MLFPQIQNKRENVIDGRDNWQRNHNVMIPHARAVSAIKIATIVTS